MVKNLRICWAAMAAACGDDSVASTMTGRWRTSSSCPKLSALEAVGQRRTYCIVWAARLTKQPLYACVSFHGHLTCIRIHTTPLPAFASGESPSGSASLSEPSSEALVSPILKAVVKCTESSGAEYACESLDNHCCRIVVVCAVRDVQPPLPSRQPSSGM